MPSAPLTPGWCCLASSVTGTSSDKNTVARPSFTPSSLEETGRQGPGQALQCGPCPAPPPPQPRALPPLNRRERPWLAKLGVTCRVCLNREGQLMLGAVSGTEVPPVPTGVWGLWERLVKTPHCPPAACSQVLQAVGRQLPFLSEGRLLVARAGMGPPFSLSPLGHP